MKMVEWTKTKVNHQVVELKKNKIQEKTPGNPIRKRDPSVSPFGPSVYKQSIHQPDKKGKTDKTKKQVM